MLAAYAFFSGAFSGIFWSSSAPVVAELVGVKQLAPAMSTIWLLLVAPILVAEPIVVLIVNASRDNLGRTGADAFTYAIVFSGVCYVLSALSLFGAKCWLQKSATIFRKS